MTHPYLGGINAKQIRFTTDVPPFSSFMVRRAMEHGGLLRKYWLERLPLPVSFPRNVSLRKQGAGIQEARDGSPLWHFPSFVVSVATSMKDCEGRRRRPVAITGWGEKDEAIWLPPRHQIASPSLQEGSP